MPKTTKTTVKTASKEDSSAFAIIATGGKQYKVVPGQVLRVEKLPKPAEGTTSITFDEVLMIVNGADVKIGTPTIAGASVKAEFVIEGRAKKITILKYKSKVRYKKKAGHRQPFTEVKIVAVA